MSRHERNNLISSLDEAKATAHVRGDEVRARQSARPSGPATRTSTTQRRSAAAPSPSSSYATSRSGRSSAARRSVFPSILVVLVIVVFLAVLWAVRGAMQQQGGSTDDGVDDPVLYVSPYDWSYVVRENGRWSYVVNGQVKSRLGIDVSENNQLIDWGQVAADGIDFAMIRLGYRGTSQGEMYLDAYYWANLTGAKEAGIDCGVYFFSQAVTEEEAREEAEFVLNYLNGTPLEYPIAFDSEEKVAGIGKTRTTGLTRDQMTAIKEAFCERIEQAGYTAMVYGNSHDMSRYSRSSLIKRDVWWAEYGSPSPLAKLDIALWQYASDGSVAGIPTVVDMNMDLRGVLE